MTRKVKALGVAVAAVLAISALASSASAADFRSPAATTNLHTTQLTTGVLGTTAGSITCEAATFTAQMTSSTQSSVQTNALTYNGCHIIILGSTVSATLSVNGCNYKFYAVGTFDIVCPAGATIEHKASGCTQKIPGQTGLKGVSYTNNGNHIDINASITGLKYTHSGFLCGTGEGTNGTYSGKITVEGKNTAGTVVNLDYS